MDNFKTLLEKNLKKAKKSKATNKRLSRESFADFQDSDAMLCIAKGMRQFNYKEVNDDIKLFVSLVDETKLYGEQVKLYNSFTEDLSTHMYKIIDRLYKPAYETSLALEDEVLFISEFADIDYHDNLELYGSYDDVYDMMIDIPTYAVAELNKMAKETILHFNRAIEKLTRLKSKEANDIISTLNKAIADLAKMPAAFAKIDDYSKAAKDWTDGWDSEDPVY